MITKEMIHSYLSEYSIIERIAKSYYEKNKNKEIYDIEKEIEYYRKNGNKFLEYKKEMEEKYPGKVIGLDNVDLDAYDENNFKEKMLDDQKVKSKIHFLHNEFFDETKNIFINKHMRYTYGTFHDHDFIEMCYIYKGSVTQYFRNKEGCEEKKEILEEGNLLIIPPGMQHKVSIYDESVMINIIVNKYTFEKTFLGDIPQESLLYHFFCEMIFSQESGIYIVFSDGNKDVLNDKLLDLMVAYLNDDNYRSKICDHYLSIFFLNLLGQCQNVKMSSYLGKEGEQIARILLFIRNHYAQISLEDVAEEFHYSKTYLNRIFKKHTGTTILKQIQDTRLEESCALLCNTRMSVEDIALHVGYEDTSYYIELFKKKYKTTPLHYRQTMI